MDFSKLKNRLLIVLCVLVVFLPFYLITPVLATEENENISYDYVSGITIRQNSNVFISNSGARVGYVQLEKGYIYTLYNNSEASVSIATSNDIPALNGTYNFLLRLDPGQNYYYRADNNNTFLYIDFNTTSTLDNIIVTRSLITGMDSTVQELASVVSPNAIWGVFDISINYIVITVCVAFGIFIIFKLIRKLSKGKEGL